MNKSKNGSNTYNSNKLREIKKRRPGRRLAGLLTGIGLLSAGWFGSGARSAYVPAVKKNQLTPWQQIPPPPFPFMKPSTERQAWEKLQRNIPGMEIEYTQYVDYIGGTINRVPVKYRYKTSTHIPGEFRWPRGVKLDWGGSITSHSICAMLTAATAWAVGTQGAPFMRIAEAAAICAALQARHWAPGQYLAFQIAVVDVIASYAAYKYYKSEIKRKQDDIDAEIKRIQANHGLRISNRSAAAAEHTAVAAASQAVAAANQAVAAGRAANAATQHVATARQGLAQNQRFHQSSLGLGRQGLAQGRAALYLQARATAAAEKQAATQTILALVQAKQALQIEGRQLDESLPNFSRLLNNQMSIIDRSNAALAQNAGAMLLQAPNAWAGTGNWAALPAPRRTNGGNNGSSPRRTNGGNNGSSPRRKNGGNNGSSPRSKKSNKGRQ